ncbi:MAG: sigma-70 region 4 domain-containing protein [Sphaerochaeta sp.]|nr:sigma-70 region 4 domain-containing protein [Sphaerochaeta sp.]
MTENQKTQILEMRRLGCTYRHIATSLSLPEGTVKSYCIRAARKGPVTPPPETDPSVCKQCGGELIQVAKRKRRIFCSKACRQKWWNSHLFLVSQGSEALYHFTCPTCNKAFTAYGNEGRKFCSHQCYIRSRYGKDAPDGR